MRYRSFTDAYEAVNPQAVNEGEWVLELAVYSCYADLNVYTLNKRSVMLIHANLGSNRSPVPVAFVAVGG